MGCALRPNPARRSPQGCCAPSAATPSGRYSRHRSAARGQQQRRQKETRGAEDRSTARGSERLCVALPPLLPRGSSPGTPPPEPRGLRTLPSGHDGGQQQREARRRRGPHPDTAASHRPQLPGALSPRITLDGLHAGADRRSHSPRPSTPACNLRYTQLRALAGQRQRVGSRRGPHPETAASSPRGASGPLRPRCRPQWPSRARSAVSGSAGPASATLLASVGPGQSRGALAAATPPPAPPARDTSPGRPCQATRA